jgi:two-component system, LytTR family, response regulator AlgR
MIPRLFIVDDEAPARIRLHTVLADIASDCPHQVVGEADNAELALERIASLHPDIVLLDVQMPGMNGIQLAARLAASMKPAPVVIFVTAFDEFALKAFEVQALDYLVKPVRAARLAEAIRRAAGLCSGLPRTGARLHFSVPERGRVLLVPVAHVLYLKAELKYVTLRTKAHEYLIEESLTSLEEEFSAIFVRVHRNALVARDAVLGVERASHAVDGEAAEGERVQESWQVLLRDVDERLPISRRQWPTIKALLR